MTIEKEKFNQSVIIYSIPKHYSVFVQTDKAVYKPGDVLKYRILVLNDETKLQKFIRIRVKILDGVGNIVKDIEIPQPKEKIVKSNDSNSGEKDEANSGEKPNSDEKIESTTETKKTIKTARKTGKPAESNILVDIKNPLENPLVGNFSIASGAVSGAWQINVIIDDDDSIIEMQRFEVKEYILPRFEVIVDTKDHVSQKETEIRLALSAFYTFGEFVQGQAEITAHVFDSAYPDYIQKNIRKKASMDFPKQVLFDIKSDLGIRNVLRPFIVNFTVDFTETLTGQKMTLKKSVTVHDHEDYSIELIRSQTRFKPGFPFKLQAVVKNFDGSMSSNVYEPVRLNVVYNFKPLVCSDSAKINTMLKSSNHNMEQRLKNGIAEFVLNIPENTTSFQASAEYLKAKKSINVIRVQSESREYLFVELRTK